MLLTPSGFLASNQMPGTPAHNAFVMKPLEAAGLVTQTNNAKGVPGFQIVWNKDGPGKNELILKARAEKLAIPARILLLALMLQGVGFKTADKPEGKTLTVDEIKKFIDPQPCPIPKYLSVLKQEGWIQYVSNNENEGKTFESIFLLPDKLLNDKPTQQSPPSLPSSEQAWSRPQEEKDLLKKLISQKLDGNSAQLALLKELIDLNVPFEHQSEKAVDISAHLKTKSISLAYSNLTSMVRKNWLIAFNPDNFQYRLSNTLWQTLHTVGKRQPTAPKPTDVLGPQPILKVAPTHKPRKTEIPGITSEEDYLAALEIDPRLMGSNHSDYYDSVQQWGKSFLECLAEKAFTETGWQAVSRNDLFSADELENRKTMDFYQSAIHQLTKDKYIESSTEENQTFYKLNPERLEGLALWRAYQQAEDVKKPALLRVLKDPNIPALAKWVYIAIHQDDDVGFDDFKEVSYSKIQERLSAHVAEELITKQTILTMVDILQNQRYLHMKHPFILDQSRRSYQLVHI